MTTPDTPPVALVIFNRPHLTAQVYERVRAARPRRLLVVADGPRPTHPEDVRLCEATREVLEEAIRDEGSTLGDATYRTALNQSGQYQAKHRVYCRAGENCPTCCEVPIRRFVQAQRSTFFCPHCQRR